MGLLTEKEIRTLETGIHSDGEGLVLDIRKSGRKYWIARMWVDGKEHRRSLGPHPKVSLKEAREKNRLLRQEGIRPKGALFGDIAEEFFVRRVDERLSPLYGEKQRMRLRKYILPSLGRYAMNEITSAQVLNVCRIIEDGGIHETAHRVKQIIGQVFRYAVATGRADSDPTTALHGALTPPTVKHHSTLTEKEDIRTLLRAVSSYRYPVLRTAMLFSIYTFCRPGEVRRAEWCEIVDAEWRIPAEKMKMRRMHVVPLCEQCLQVVDDIRVITGAGRYLFPSARDRNRPMSENAVRVALRTLGFDITPHGFRAMASTILNEQGFPPDMIERQLAHDEKNKIRAAYNHAQYMAERREMMRWWGEWCENLMR